MIGFTGEQKQTSEVSHNRCPGAIDSVCSYYEDEYRDRWRERRTRSIHELMELCDCESRSIRFGVDKLSLSSSKPRVGTHRLIWITASISYGKLTFSVWENDIRRMIYQNWSGYRPITFTRKFEPRHSILSYVRTNVRKYVVAWLEHSRESNRRYMDWLLAELSILWFINDDSRGRRGKGGRK